MPRSNPLRRVPEAAARLRDLPTTFAAEVVEVREGCELLLKRRGEVGALATARLGVIPGYHPTTGDVVAVTTLAGGEAVVLGVLSAAAVPTLALADGATARIVDGALEVADPSGRLLVRYHEGTAEIAPSSGDLRLSAPSGRVVIAAGLDIALSAQRDVTFSAERAVETTVAAPSSKANLEDASDPASRLRLDAKGFAVATPSVDVRSRRARFTLGVAEVLAKELKTSALRIETTATALETHAERVRVQTATLVEEVSELLETRAGRMRSIVRGVFSLRSRSTTLKSKDDTAIDGRHVLLG